MHVLRPQESLFVRRDVFGSARRDNAHLSHPDGDCMVGAFTDHTMLA